jgi:sirohydrochlorin ferrochelatase
VKTGIVIFAHGSSVASANDAVRAVAAEVARAGGFELLEAAFLEQGSPDLAGAVARLVERGAARVVVIPYFLTLGIHLQRDLPRIVEELSRVHNGVRIDVTEPLDGHPALRDILLARVRQALAR